MGSAATERWLLLGIGVFTTIVTATLLIVRPAPLSRWLPGEAPERPRAVTAETSRDPGRSEAFSVTPGDGQITVTWPSGDGMRSYRTDAVNEAGPPVTLPCLPVTTGTSGDSRCVVSDVRNGDSYLLTVRPAAETDTSAPPRLFRVVPRPTILESPSTVVWLDASDYATITPHHAGAARIGSRVLALRDKSSHHLDATQSDAPREPALGQLGRLPALLFDGDDALRLDGRSLPSGNHPSTVLVVASQDGLSPETVCFHNLLSWGAGQLGQARILHKGCRTSLAFAETWGTYVDQKPTQVWPTGRASVMVAVYDGAGASVRLNGIPSYRWKASASKEMNTAVTEDARLGGVSWDPVGGWVGRVGEVVMFDRVLTPTELVVMEEYLATKWQVLMATG